MKLVCAIAATYMLVDKYTLVHPYLLADNRSGFGMLLDMLLDMVLNVLLDMLLDILGTSAVVLLLHALGTKPALLHIAATYICNCAPPVRCLAHGHVKALLPCNSYT